MSLDTRVAAFVEYVLRPLSDDWRGILEEIRALNIGLTQETLRRMTFALGCWHVIGEIIRATSYVLITWMICKTLLALWPIL